MRGRVHRRSPGAWPTADEINDERMALNGLPEAIPQQVAEAAFERGSAVQ